MAGPTYSLHAIVLRKTKLGESDLILTLLAEDGRQVRAVAKGARQAGIPRSPPGLKSLLKWKLSASGKSLDIVKEVRLVDAHQGIVFDAQHARHALLWSILHRASRSLTLRRRRCSRFSLRRLSMPAPAMPRRR